MPDDLLPLFPLAVVLLPGHPLPLHIFEERYKEMIGKVLETPGAEFGVVRAAGRGLMPLGCTATVEDVLRRYDDGRLDILTLGRRRFQIEAIDQDREYLRGQVTFFDDDQPDAPATLREQAVTVCHTLPADSGEEAEGNPGGDDPFVPGQTRLSFHLARRITDLEFRQTLLGIRSEVERLERLIEFVPGYVQHARQAERLREVAPKNGHGKHPPGLDQRGGG